MVKALIERALNDGDLMVGTKTTSTIFIYK
jgi:hypothetical protein